MKRVLCTVVSVLTLLIVLMSCDTNGSSPEAEQTYKFNSNSNYVKQADSAHTAGLMKFWKKSDKFRAKMGKDRMSPWVMGRYMMSQLDSTVENLYQEYNFEGISENKLGHLKDDFKSCLMVYDSEEGADRPRNTIEMPGLFEVVNDDIIDNIYDTELDPIVEENLREDLLKVSGVLETSFNEMVEEIDTELKNKKAIITRKEALEYCVAKATRYELKVKENFEGITFKTEYGALAAELSYGTLQSSLGISKNLRFDRYYPDSKLSIGEIGSWINNYFLRPGAIDAIGGYALGGVAGYMCANSGAGLLVMGLAVNTANNLGSAAASGLYDFYSDCKKHEEDTNGKN